MRKGQAAELDRRIDYDGKLHTIKELAALAGCRCNTMRSRLKKWGAQHAVAMGAGDMRRRRGVGQPAGEHYTVIGAETIDYGGQALTVAELAAVAGCSYSTMRLRLKRGPDATAAVAMGKANQSRSVPKGKPVLAKPAARGPKPFAPGTVAIETAATVRIVAVTPRPRFAPESVPPMFAALRPGEYLPEQSPWAMACAGDVA